MTGGSPSLMTRAGELTELGIELSELTKLVIELSELTKLVIELADLTKLGSKLLQLTKLNDQHILVFQLGADAQFVQNFRKVPAPTTGTWVPFAIYKTQLSHY
ncbi:hypothetical protein PCASD_25912 [Puccinia coronata f. sp. avenae]|uniref:Uncharacterized protein n=1 Tax=Puccinia coronata f. sp. avenae TaxID=200324 RepID=A0A2N5TKN3_9BASI|nr:hypothetical protein PCASD_25912 [Puccinia coronata f. sp. avenae]